MASIKNSINRPARKGTSELWWIISAAVIALVVVIIILVWFTGAGRNLFGGLDQTIVGLKDYDQDGSSDLLDKCPCDFAIQELRPGEQCSTDKNDCNQKIKSAQQK
ncbi:MAG TPA: hypothetical protein VJH68_04540 [Candidatus Nanoarchaeia archaeon]|nr:hypothetical protein [Candidatus Nanoarchaeia archaeon]